MFRVWTYRRSLVRQVNACISMASFHVTSARLPLATAGRNARMNAVPIRAFSYSTFRPSFMTSRK